VTDESVKGLNRLCYVIFQFKYFISIFRIISDNNMSISIFLEGNKEDTGERKRM